MGKPRISLRKLEREAERRKEKNAANAKKLAEKARKVEGTPTK